MKNIYNFFLAHLKYKIVGSRFFFTVFQLYFIIGIIPEKLAAQAPDIDDGNACTTDAYNSSAGVVTHIPVVFDDNDACTSDGCNSLTGVFHNSILKIVLDSLIPVSSVGFNDGAIFTSSSGGSLPYSYLWNTGQTTDDIADLYSGIYSLVVNDLNGCSDTITVDLINFDSLHTNICVFDAILNSRLQEVSGYQQRFDSLESAIQDYINNNNNNRQSYTTTFTIPVVVHVIQKSYHNYGEYTNISYKQIQSQINALNAAFLKDYANYNQQTHGPLAQNVNIKFCLARIPTPNTIQWPTHNNEIEYGVLRYLLNYDNPVHELDTRTEIGLLLDITHPTGSGNFPFDKYLNIWLVADICNGSSSSPCTDNSDSGPSIVGFATMPPLTSGLLDGIVHRIDVFGDNSTSKTPLFSNSALVRYGLEMQGKVLAHEAGHYLELFHTFETPCAGTSPFSLVVDALHPDPCNLNGDKCCDTPPTNTSEFKCGPIPTSCPALLAQVENYMSYSSGPILNTFTTNQKERIAASMMISDRKTLWTDANLTLTGVKNVTTPGKCSCCVLSADFNIDFSLSCPAGALLFFTPDGPAYCANKWTWTFQGGTPPVWISDYPDSPNPPLITFPTNVGTYTITLTVSDGVNSKTTSQTIHLDCCPKIIASNSSPVCTGGEVQFYSDGGQSYVWTGPFALAPVQNPVLMNAVPGTYNFTVTVPSVNGCPTTATTKVIINPLPVITSGSNSPLGCGSTLNLFSSGGSHYSWIGPLNYESDEQNPVRTGSATDLEGTYTVTVSNGDSWKSVADFLGSPRDQSTCFSIGDKGYVGIGNSCSIPYFADDFFEFTPGSGGAGVWQSGSSLNGDVRRGAFGFSIGNVGYFGGGSLDNQDNLSKTFWKYTPQVGATPGYWTQQADFGGEARDFAVGFSIGKKGYAGTGEIRESPCNRRLENENDFWEYDPENNLWTQKQSFPGSKRLWAVGFNIGDKGYIGTGGEFNTPTYHRDLYEYDPHGIDVNGNPNGSWTQKASLPPAAHARWGAVGFSIGCKGYVGTGYDGTNVLNDFWEYTPGPGLMGGSWSKKADVGTIPRVFAVGFSVGKKGYIGTGTNGSCLVDFWEYDPEGCGECSSTASVIVEKIPNASLTACTDNAIGSALFNLTDANPIVGANTPGAIITYHESNSDAENNIDQLVSPYRNTTPSTQIIFARVELVSAACIYISPVTLTVNPLPTATTTSLTVCDDNSDGFAPFVLTGANTIVCGSQTGISISYHITLADANNNTSSLPLNLPYVNVIANSQTIYARVQFNTGCYSICTVTLTVNPLPVPFIISNSPVCDGTLLSLEASGGVIYNWNGPHGSSTDNSYSFVASASDGGTYDVTITGNNGCTISAFTNVIVNPLPAPNASSNSPVCVGSTLNLFSNNGTINWSGPHGSSSDNPYSFVAVLEDAGTYYITITDNNGCSSSSYLDVIINPLPIATAFSNSPVCIGGIVNLTSFGGTSNWSGPHGTSSDNPYSFQASDGDEGTYNVVVTDNNGCTAASSTNVSLIVCPPCDACEDFESGLNGWNVSPLPANYPLTLQGTDDHYVKFINSQESTVLEAGIDFHGKWCCGELCYDYKILPLNLDLSPAAEYPVIIIRSNSLGFKFTSNVLVKPGDGWVHICVPISDCDFNEFTGLGSWTPLAGTSKTAWVNVINNVTNLQFEVPDNPQIHGDIVGASGFDNVCFHPGVSTIHIESCKEDLCVKLDGCCKTFTYLWSTNEKTECIKGVEGDSYYVVATDQSGKKYIAYFTMPIALHLDCFGSAADQCYPLSPSTGKIKIESRGGTGKKTIVVKKININQVDGPVVATLIVTGDFTSNEIKGLKTGRYCAFITDENGCTDFCCCDLTEYLVGPGPTGLSICAGSTYQLHSTNAGPAPANASGYIFTTSNTGAFLPLNGSNVQSSLQSDEASVEVPLGFSFNYEGVSYTSVNACTNGYLSFGSDGILSTNNLDSGFVRNAIAPFWDNLSGMSIDGTDTAYSIPSYLTIGVAPDRIFTFEWLNWYWDNSAVDSSITFQVKLYENGNHIEFIYRQESGTPVNPSASIGISGSFPGNYLSLNDASLSPNVSNISETKTIAIRPATNQSYKFTPPSIPTINYSWSPAASLDDPTTSSPFATPPIGTTIYTVTVTTGSCNATATTSVTSGQALLCSDVTLDNLNVCSGKEFTVTAHSTGGGIPLNYAWSDGVGGVYPNLQSISPVLSAGLYTINCIISDNCGESCSSYVIINVYSSPASAISPSGPLSVCSNAVPVTLTAITDIGTNFQWDRNGINLYGQISPATNVNSSATYNVTVSSSSGDSWTQKSNIGGAIRYHAPGFSIGDKGYFGTGYNGTVLRDFWEYDPSNNTWTQKADFGGTARVDATGFSIGDKGYIGLGVAVTETKKDFWEYDPIINLWTQKADFGGIVRARATGFGIGTKGYLGLGETAPYYNDFWEYDQLTDTWLQKANFPGLPRGAAVGFSIGSKGYIGTGWGGSHNKDFWEYDPLSNSWTRKADFGGIGREFAVGFSIGTKGYIGTGADSYLRDFWEYNQSSDTWIRKTDFGGSARYAAFGFSIGDKGYIGAGNDGFGLQNDFWEYDPGNECISTASSVVNVILNDSPDISPSNINSCFGALSGTSFTGSCTSPSGLLNWYNVPLGGTPLASTSNFNPITDGGANTTMPGVVNFYAECSSGGCISERIQVTFTISGIIDDGDPCTIDACDVSTGIITHMPGSCGVVLNSNILLQGYYIGNGILSSCLNIAGVSSDPNDADTIFISAMNPTSPYTIVDRKTGILKTNGDVTVSFSPSVVPGNSYYLKINHRNSAETWSKNPIVMTPVTTYSFASSASQAFGDNEIETFDFMGFAIYCGDINQDGSVDGSDFLELDPSIQNGDGGYAVGDINGDGAVDGTDFLFIDLNIQLGMGAIGP